jgi:hypothetical protein
MFALQDLLNVETYLSDLRVELELDVALVQDLLFGISAL